MVTSIIGSMYLVSDLNMVNDLKRTPNTKIVSLTEDADFMKMVPEAVPGTVFLPPYEALVFLTDSDMTSFSDVYMSYLMGSERISMYAAVLIRAILMEGINIVIFIPKDELELNFFQILSHYFNITFGVTIGTPVNNFMYNPAYDAVVCQLLYHFEYMSLEELLINFPQGVMFDMTTVMNLSVRNANILPAEIALDPSYASQGTWFYNYKERIKQNNNTFLQRGITRI